MSEFDRWETRFAAPGYVFGEAPNAFLAAQKTRLPGRGRALAVSDGEGRNGVWLAEQGLDVVSMDFSPSAQAKALALAARRGVTITTELADMDTYPWPEDTYDVVAAIFIQFLGPPGRARAFAGMRRTLKPGGLLLMQGYTPAQLAHGTGGPKQLENLYTRALLAAEFSDMAALTITDYEADLQEGAGHRGFSAVIDLIAVK